MRLKIIQDLDLLSSGWLKRFEMKYTKQITFLLFLNLIIVLLSIFAGNLTRKLEITNNLIQQNIENQKEQLQLNKLEYSFYNNPNYLKKLHNIYFSFEESFPEKKIISYSNLLNIKGENVILVKTQSK